MVASQKRRGDRQSGSARSSSTEISTSFFVVGDLVVDHTIFVSDVSPTYPTPVTGEASLRVTRRLETAGGAATTARTVDVLTSGQTFLWGHIGSSPWGSFRTILESSQALDGSMSRIDFRGVRDHSDANLAIVSRLVQATPIPGVGERYIRKSRFSDTGEIHVPDDSSVKSVSHHLQQAHIAKAPLSAIILNDLHIGTLHSRVLEVIANFAKTHNIPLIFRTRQDSAKISEIPADFVVCTLSEWCHLTGADQAPLHWSRNIRTGEVGDDFCRLTLSAFRNIRGCIVLVGDDWIDQVYVVERGSKSDPSWHLYIEPGVESREKFKSQQVGSSDVFAGALTVGLCRSSPSGAHRLAHALHYAIEVVSAYQTSGWHQLPRSDKLPPADSYLNASLVPAQAARSYATPYLPLTGVIDLSLANSGIPGVYSCTEEVISVFALLEKDLLADDRSMALVATGGSGKSDVAKRLISIASEKGLCACDLDDLDVNWNWSRPEQTINAIERACLGLKEGRPFVVVDEALKKPGGDSAIKNGVVLLNHARKKGIRLLLVDADFAKLSEKAGSQFLSRLSRHTLPAPWERPLDVPFVLASCLRRLASSLSPTVRIETAALVSIVEWMLENKRSYRDLNEVAKQIVSTIADRENFEVTWDILPAEIRSNPRPTRGSGPKSFTVKWD